MKKQFFTLLLIAAALFIKAQGTWTPLKNALPNGDGEGMLLMTDGTVLAKTGHGVGQGNQYYKLTPDIHGSYVNGTWTAITPMHYDRKYYSSQVLKDGRVYVAGGEDGAGGPFSEIYDPGTNVWTDCPPAAGGISYSDANSVILEDGRVLQNQVAAGNATFLFDPVTNTYAAGPSTLGNPDESFWLKLPDNSTLFVDEDRVSSERYIPSLNQWIRDGLVPDSLYFQGETGTSYMLPDGRALFLGAAGHTAFYQPSGDTSMGVWTAGKDIPYSMAANDAPGASLANGQILFTAGNIGNVFDYSFFIFNYLTNSYSLVPPPGGGTTVNNNLAMYTTMLDLPDGTVLFSAQHLYIYTPDGAQLQAGKPSIKNITEGRCGVYTITGTQFNGISQGACYGDDWQMATNYPLVRLTTGDTVYYATTSNWNSTGVQRGNLPDTAQFTLPENLPVGIYSLVVTTNGISSDPVTFIPHATVANSGPVCSGNTLQLTSGGGTAYKWTGPNNFTSTEQNPVITNVTAANAGTYVVQVKKPGCVIKGIVKGFEQTATTIVKVNSLPTSTIGSNSPVCAGTAINLKASGGSSYRWAGPNGFTSTQQNPVINAAFVNDAGTYSVTITDCFGSVKAHTQVDINQGPFVVARNNGPLCSGDTLQLNVTGILTNSYFWSGPYYFENSGPAQTIANVDTNKAGIYVVTASDANGCTSVSTTNVVVRFPKIIAAGPITFCEGGSVTLTATPGTAYLWNTGATTQSITVNNSGSFVVNENGCPSPPMAVDVPTHFEPLDTKNFAVNGQTDSAGNEYIITQFYPGEDGSAWQRTPINLNYDFDFSFYVDQCGRADGMAFVLQDQSLKAQGHSGPTLGYYNDSANFNHSFAVELDIHNDGAAYYDTDSSHIAIVQNSLPVPLTGTFPISPKLGNCTPRLFRVTWNHTHHLFSVYFEGNLITSYTGDLVADIFLNNPIVHFGFTGGTSGLIATQTVSVYNLSYSGPFITSSAPTGSCIGTPINTTLTANAGGAYAWSTGETTQRITVKNTGAYSVTITSRDGCFSGADTIYITQSTKPTVTALGPISFCSGDSVILTAAPGPSFLWNTGETTQSIVVRNIGEYYVTDSGCQSLPVIVDVSKYSLFDFSNFQVNGIAASNGNANYTVTVAASDNSQVGSAWQRTPLNLNNDFDFTFNINQCGNGDGMAFVLQSSGLNALGNRGGDIGYFHDTLDFNHSLAVDLDIYNHQGAYGDTDNSNIGIFQNSIPRDINGPFDISPLLGGCQSNLLRITWNHTTKNFSVYFGGNLVTSFVDDIIANIFNGNPVVYFGFTGATGGATAVQKFIVLDLSTSVPLITASGPTTFCMGDSVILTAASGKSYIWNDGETTQAITVKNTGSYSCIIIQGNCPGITDTVNITVNPLVTPAVSISASRNNICPGTAVTFTAVAINGGTSPGYNWLLNGISVQNGKLATYTNASLNNGDSITCVLTSNAVCPNNTVAVSNGINMDVISQPASPVISGPSGGCRGETGVLYSVAPIPGATSYNWTLPAGVTGSSTTSNIVVDFTNTFTGGSICVKAVNSCFTSNTICQNLAAFTIKPAAPGVISGGNIACPGTTKTFTVAAVTNATTYTWTAPFNATITAGQGTPKVTVSFNSLFASGSLAVQASNCAGGSAKTFLKLSKNPVEPTGITGSTVGLCGGSTYTYTCTLSSGAISYTWSVPAGSVINSGQGTTSISVTLTHGFAQGTISVLATSICGSSPANSITINGIALTGKPVSLTGPTADLCDVVDTFSIPPMKGASSYSWSIPAGCSIVGAATGAKIVLDVSSGFTGGSLCAAGVNSCGVSGASQCITLSDVPPVTTTIYGSRSVCANQAGLEYTVISEPGITYQWTLPADATITDVEGTSTIIVTWGTTSGNVSVQAVNSCGGISPPASIAVAIQTTGCTTGPAKSEEVSNSNTYTGPEEILSIFPNPTSSSAILVFTSDQESKYFLAITDVIGRVINRSSGITAVGENKISIDLSGNSSGIYFIRLTGETREIGSGKLIKSE